MESQLRDDLLDIWEQRDLPVIVNRGSGFPLRIRLPKNVDAFNWIKSDRRNHPEWSTKYLYWKAPRAWLNLLVYQALLDFKKVYIIQVFQSQEKCARICKEAKGFDCDCSCLGEYHGTESMHGWFEVSETFATRYGERKMGCRLLIKKAVSREQELLYAAAMLV